MMLVKKNTKTDTKFIIQPINSNFNQQHQYDVLEKNTQTDPILHSTKYTNTYKPTYNNNTQTDPIHQSK